MAKYDGEEGILNLQFNQDNNFLFVSGKNGNKLSIYDVNKFSGEEVKGEEF